MVCMIKWTSFPNGTQNKVQTMPTAAARQAAGCVADRDLGADVFGDPLRMWRDLLGDTSRRRAGGGFFPFMGVD